MTQIGSVVRKLSEINPDDAMAGGQPRWYWGLSKEGKMNELIRRAERCGAKYVRDGSYDGLKEDGAAPEKSRAKREAKGLRMTAKRREKIERRASGEEKARE